MKLYRVRAYVPGPIFFFTDSGQFLIESGKLEGVV